MNRREFTSALALAGFATVARGAQSAARADEATPFGADTVRALAERLAARDYEAPPLVPDAVRALDYDQYRDIRFREDAAFWAGENRGFRMDVLHSGFVYEHAVDVHLVEDGVARRISYSPDLFTFGPQIEEPPGAGQNLLAGVCLRSLINSGEYWDEIAVFQGASYFRAVSESLIYGLSARGLAIDTAESTGEEFPVFRSFWVERPPIGAKTVTVHALLDSPSVTGAYRFQITPGHRTRMEVDVTLYARRELRNFGLAPLTSMFMFDSTNRGRFDDFRPAVHDSDGLVVRRGNREWLWRPLANPTSLQLSAFLDSDPSLYGLVQRKRDFDTFQDLEARYELRPSASVEPKAGWGEGQIVLVEIPATRETNDNIVAYWRPARPLEAGQSLSYGYWLDWGPPVAEPRLARVGETRCGLSFDQERRLFVVDFHAPTFPGEELGSDVSLVLTVSEGEVNNVVLRRNDFSGGCRVSFELAPGTASLIELRLVLKREEQPVSETWLYRWMA